MLGLLHLRARQCISIRQNWLIIMAAGLGSSERHVTIKTRLQSTEVPAQHNLTSRQVVRVIFSRR